MIELREITKRFGDVLANDRVNLAVAPGTIHAYQAVSEEN